jgi:hypothetical protein
MFDLFSTSQLHDFHDQAFKDHTTLYLTCQSLPVTHPRYPATAAALYQMGEHLRAIGAEITRRDQETANA